MRRNYLGKEKGAEVFPERRYTHKGLRLLRREGLQRLPGSAVPGILQAKTLDWVSISFSNA